MKRQVRQFVNLLPVDRGVEREIELIHGLHFAEGRGLGAALGLPVAADRQFILEDQLQEFGMRQPAGGGFLQAYLQGFGEAGEAEFS